MKISVQLIFGFLIAITLSCAQDRVTTIAGHPLVSGSVDGNAGVALFSDPASISADEGGNLYIADSANHVIRKISSDGTVSTFSGRPGVQGFQDGSSAMFNSPCGIAITPGGDLLIADTGNHVIRKITQGGVASTIAGAAGQSGALDGIGSAARFDSPLGLAVGTNGTIYVADSGNHTIRAISTDGEVSALAGSAGDWGTNDGPGLVARFNGPVGLALDSAGNLFVSDSNNQTIRRISPDHFVTTWAGSPLIDGFTNGDRHAARFAKPAELRFDSHDNLFVADSFNHAVRKISADGKVTTVTGFARQPGASDGINGQPRLNNPYSLAFLPDGSLAISDTYNQTLRRALPPIELKPIRAFDADGFAWNSIIGKHYQVQRATADFRSWIDIGASITANETICIFKQAPAGSSEIVIYRVIDVP
jgi:DNA-binding beta-propeller fold protein YncE